MQQKFVLFVCFFFFVSCFSFFPFFLFIFLVFVLELQKYNIIVYPTDARGSTYIPALFRPTGWIYFMRMSCTSFISILISIWNSNENFNEQFLKIPGPPPIAPENVTITETSDGIILSWNYPRRGNIAIAYFTVDYCYDDQWRRLSKAELKSTETNFQGICLLFIIIIYYYYLIAQFCFAFHTNQVIVIFIISKKSESWKDVHVQD